jgi:hypothetical protein
MMNFLDFLRRMFPMAQPPAEPALKPLRKPRAKNPTIRKSRIVATKKKPAPKKK